MHEFETSIPDWRQQIESARFYSTRKGDVLTGTQFTVYTRPGIDFVLKVPKDPFWMFGYELVEELAPELAIPFAHLKGAINLNLDNKRNTVPEAIIQLKVPELHTVIATAATTKDQVGIGALVREQAEGDRALLKKGIFVPDPNFANYGIGRDGDVRRFDFGDARISFTEDGEYEGLARGRAGSHYVNAFFLEKFGSEELVKWYTKFFSLPPAHPRASTFGQIILSQDLPTWDPEVAVFLARIGHEEFQRFAPNGAPSNLNEGFIRNFPQLISKLE